MRWGNCWWFAFRQWWRHGGYVVLEQSKYGWWPHMLWSANLVTFLEFHPSARKRRRVIPPIWFRGAVRVVLLKEKSL